MKRYTRVVPDHILHTHSPQHLPVRILIPEIESRNTWSRKIWKRIQQVGEPSQGKGVECLFRMQILSLPQRKATGKSLTEEGTLQRRKGLWP